MDCSSTDIHSSTRRGLEILQALQPFLLYTALTAWLTSPLFHNPNAMGISDWDQHSFYYGSFFRSLYEFGQPPFWNPWQCGGNVLWQNPQMAVFSPVYLLAPMMSMALALKINLVLHYLVGFWGMHLLLRRVFLIESLPLTAYLSCLVVASGGIAMHLAVGHSTFLPFFYIPLFWYFFLQGLKTGVVKQWILSALILSLFIYNAGLYIFVFLAVATGCLSLMMTILLRRIRPIAVYFATFLLAGAFAVPKLWPVLVY